LEFGCSVKELLVRVDARELAEWQAYYKIRPFGERLSDMRMARLCCIIANAFRGKNSRAMSEADFMFKFENEPEDETVFRMS
jgi:hypothetical protein